MNYSLWCLQGPGKEHKCGNCRGAVRVNNRGTKQKSYKGLSCRQLLSYMTLPGSPEPMEQDSRAEAALSAQPPDDLLAP